MEKKRHRAIMNKYLCWGIVSLMLACAPKGHGPMEGLRQDVYSEDSAMAHYLVAPERSITLLDSAVIVGNLSAQRGEYLKAIVLADMVGPDTCMRICQRLIDEKVWETLPDSENATYYQVDVYRLMANVAQSLGNHTAVVRCAREGIKLSHGIDILKGDESELLGRMGMVLCQTGQQAAGISALRRAEKLALSDHSWSALISYLNNTKKFYKVYQENAQYEEAKKTIRKAMKRLEKLKKDIAKVKNAPEAMVHDSLALDEFIQFYHHSLYGFMANTYAELGEMDSCRYWIDKLDEIPYTYCCAASDGPIHPLILLGRYDEARHSIESVKDFAGKDTISQEYIDLLMEERQLMQLTGQSKQAENLADRIISISKQVKNQNMQMMLADAASQCQLQDERQRRADAENHLMHSIIALVSVLCALIALVSTFYIRKLIARHRELKREYIDTQQELEDIKEDIKEITSVETTNNNSMSYEKIYARAEEAMRSLKPFTNPEFDLNALSALLYTNRAYLSSAINYCSGMNFRSWLGKYRVEYAKTILLEKPNIKKDLLADQCGFDNRVSLYRQFKNFEGVSPFEWAQNQIDLSFKTENQEKEKK